MSRSLMEQSPSNEALLKGKHTGGSPRSPAVPAGAAGITTLINRRSSTNMQFRLRVSPTKEHVSSKARTIRTTNGCPVELNTIPTRGCVIGLKKPGGQPTLKVLCFLRAGLVRIG